MNWDALIGAQLKAGDVGECVIDETDDLPDEVEQLLALHDKLTSVISAAQKIRKVVDGKTAELIGPGVWYPYGEYQAAWKHPWQWKPITSNMETFLIAAVEESPDSVTTLFPLTAVRKTGIEKVATQMGVNPEVAIATVLEKVWDEKPRLMFKPKDM